MRFKNVTLCGLHKVEGERKEFPHFLVEDEIREIEKREGGDVIAQNALFEKAMWRFGFDPRRADATDVKKVNAYNALAGILNSLPAGISKAAFCKAAGLPYQKPEERGPLAWVKKIMGKGRA